MSQCVAHGQSPSSHTQRRGFCLHGTFQPPQFAGRNRVFGGGPSRYQSDHPGINGKEEPVHGQAKADAREEDRGKERIHEVKSDETASSCDIGNLPDDAILARKSSRSGP